MRRLLVAAEVVFLCSGEIGLRMINHWLIVREHKNVYEFKINSSNLKVIFKDREEYTVEVDSSDPAGYGVRPMPNSIVRHFTLVNFAIWWYSIISRSERRKMRQVGHIRIDFSWWKSIL